MRVVFRVDASLVIGSGHVIRCLTFAKALRSVFPCVDVTFICQSVAGNMNDYIRGQGFDVIELCDIGANSSVVNSSKLVEITKGIEVLSEQVQLTQAKRCLRLLEDGMVNLLIVDHYQLSAPFSRAMRVRCQQVMVIDDLANRQQDADILLDQNLLPHFQTRYQDLVNTESLLLLGPQYALLRDEFYIADLHRENDDNRQLSESMVSIPRILVFFGGSDTDNLTRVALSGLRPFFKQATECRHSPLLVQESRGLRDITVDVVLGTSNPWKESLSIEFSDYQQINWHVQCDYMARLMSEATISLGAGGSTHWERAIIGLPSIVVTVADNQIETTKYLSSLGACWWLGHANSVCANDFTQAVSVLLAKAELRQTLSQNAQKLVSMSDGVPRVLSAVATKLGLGEH
ncbi:Spore coat polysaccharide biosynthesis protein, predicted glycosyltransferase [Shewanella putrefaciens]|nr:Spore coat polysaccharide biosynthesis protein, predicted glycosyltransferase [Shewanella putrefaciens]